MLVKESIGFEKYRDPKKALDLGKDSQYAREKKLEELQEKVKFFPGNGQPGDNEGRLKLYLEKVYEIEECIDYLDNAGLTIDHITASFGSRITFYLGNVIEILDGDRVLFYSPTIEEAKFVMDILRKFTIRDYDNFTYNEGKTNNGLDIMTIKEFATDILDYRIEYEKFIEEAQKYPVKKYNKNS